MSTVERMLVLDPLLFGENIPAPRDDLYGLPRCWNTVGETATGSEAGQVAAIARWLENDGVDGSATPGSRATAALDAAPLRVVANGLRGETVALVSAAMMPVFIRRGSSVRHGLASLGDLSYPIRPPET